LAMNHKNSSVKVGLCVNIDGMDIEATTLETKNLSGKIWDIIQNVESFLN